MEVEKARTNLRFFARYMRHDLEVTNFQSVYYKVLDAFAKGRIKKLIISIPPQHGKSTGSSVFLPAFLLGRNPDLKVCIGSYSATMARDFNRMVQRIIDTDEYRVLFPDTRLVAGRAGADARYQRNSDVFECVGYTGGLRVVGRGGPLTGKPVDVAILDDVYKDYQEANSPVVRESAWKWYTTVVKTRLHNDSQEIIVFTRWHEDDIVGRLEKTERIVDLKQMADLDAIPDGAWARVNFEAIKTTEKTELDQREIGEVLWPSRHDLPGLLAKRKLDKIQFDCLYQGSPGSAAGKLYAGFKTWTSADEFGVLQAKGNYTDCADEGSDNLCSVCYEKRISQTAKDEKGRPLVFLLVTDVVYTDEPIEVTTISVPVMLNRNGTQYANIESNNGGRAFAKIIEPKTMARINWFTQRVNKESRIISTAGMVMQHVVMPYGWETRFPRFYSDVVDFLRNFKANAHDDAPDVLTGIVEKEILNKNVGIRRAN
jgi:predicted phage terminase large subunit-like protein